METTSLEQLNKRYALLVKLIQQACKAHGTEVQSRIASHIRAVTGGKFGSLAQYHVDSMGKSPQIPRETKAQEYALIVRALGFSAKDGAPALGSPQWELLKGQLGAGAKQQDDDATKQSTPSAPSSNRADPMASLPEGVKRIADLPVNQEPKPPTHEAGQPRLNGKGDDLAGIIAAAIKDRLELQTEAAPLDEEKVRLIVQEEVNSLDLHEQITKANNNGSFPTERVAKMIADAMANVGVRRVELVMPNGETKPVSGLVHRQFDTILKMTRSRTGNGYSVPIWLDGPPGGGKSHIMEQIAEALGLQAYILAIGPTDTKTAIIGSVATGEFKPGIAYEPYKNGGLMGVDEIAAGDAGVLVQTNSLTANHSFRFPNGELVKKHKDFHVIVADNTRGHGNVKGMIRNRLDAATLDRFAFLKVDYDEELEAALCGNDKWAAYVKQVRDYIASNSSESVYITPRASINGAALLVGGLDAETVLDATVFKFVSKDMRAAIIGSVGTFKP